MSTSKTGNVTHDNAVNKAEAIKQAAQTPSASRTTVLAADATFHRSSAVSAIANGTSPAPYLTALRELGQSLYNT